MDKKKRKDQIIIFMIFLFLTIGNGNFILESFGNKVEYIGLVLLLISAFLKAPKNVSTLKKDILILIFSFILSFGAFYNNISINAKTMIFLSSLLLMSYSKFSEVYLNENKQLKAIGDAIIIGMIVNSFIGIITGTLGLEYNANESIFKITFLGGLKIKNYCGGIWLITYILYYVYYLREGVLNKHRIKFLVLALLIFLSGSKGACFLTIIFILFINFKNILNFKEKQGVIFYTILIPIIVFLGVYMYKNILINIPTYAYRIRGMQKMFDIMKSDLSKLMFGISNIAYADTGYDYTINMRNFLGWDASVEMAYVNILIKNGLIGILVYFKIFKDILRKTKNVTKIDKNIVICIIIVMLLSGFTETYIASIHYVVGPALFCLINSVIFSADKLKDIKSNKANN